MASLREQPPLTLASPEVKDKGILIVDDEEETRALWRATIEDRGFTKILEAGDGVECLSMLEQQGEDIYLIILDLSMPRMDGLGVLTHLVNVHKHIVGIVIITAYADIVTEEQFRASGTDRIITSHYFVKPMLEFDRLALEINKTLALVTMKRNSQSFTLTTNMLQHVASIEKELHDLSDAVRKMSSRIPNFLEQLGLDILRALLIGLFVIAVLYFGLSDLLSRLIHLIR